MEKVNEMEFDSVFGLLRIGVSSDGQYSVDCGGVSCAAFMLHVALAEVYVRLALSRAWDDSVLFGEPFEALLSRNMPEFPCVTME